MEIDLKKVVSYIHTDLSRQNVRAVISDLYPEETLWRNLLSSVVACGIVKEIQNTPVISRQRYNVFVKRLLDEYGIQESYVHEALGKWIEIYSKLDKDVEPKVIEVPKTVPIYPKKKQAPQPVNGNYGDFELNLLSQDTAEIKKFIGKEQLEMTIPNVVGGKRIIGISANAFSELSLVRKINITEGIQYLGRDSFCKCRNLHEISLPDTVSQLGSGVFSHTELDSIELPPQLTSLPDGIFRFCGNLRSIKVHGNINLIADYAFFACIGLADVTVSEGVEYIGRNIFDRCEKLKRVALPRSLKMISGTLKDHFLSKFNPEPEAPESFTIACYQGSYAMTYAKAHGYSVEDLDEVS